MDLAALKRRQAERMQAHLSRMAEQERAAWERLNQVDWEGLPMGWRETVERAERYL